ncbi:DUF6370 family protein [uncultured Polaribacter sp.]|uniref:DUF6370 family protein n=1 Tax=uncultured Polaribacter sp. TaxID=174711 RepID=UPI002604535A|nr:DUF6370 family protein [uncultured Polaribacter sp.]
MKQLILLSLIIFTSCSKEQQQSKNAEISCGQCQFNLEGEGCSLAVRFDDKAYYVTGFDIDDFGDAHDKHTGFCNVVRKGKVTGKVENGKFLASSIVLE